MASEHITVGPVRLSFPAILEPDRRGKYSVTMLIPKTDEGRAIAKQLHELAAGQVAAKWPDPEKRPRRLTMPVKDGDSGEHTNDGVPKGERYPEFSGHWYVSASSNFQPGVVDRQLQPVVDRARVYSGVWAYLQVNAFAYSNEKFGASIGLANVQIYQDDEPFAGGGAPDPGAAFRKLDGGDPFAQGGDEAAGPEDPFSPGDAKDDLESPF